MYPGHRGKPDRSREPLKWSDESPARDAKKCKHDKGNDPGSKSGDHRGNQWQTPKADVDHAQGEYDEHRRQNEESAGGEATFLSVQFPSDVYGKLLCFRAGKDHAVAQCVKELFVADPLLLDYQFVMKDRDMGRGPTKANPTESPPEPQSFGEMRRS